MDVQLDGHRVAFNAAFASIGMDCVQWSPPVYADLLGRSDGTGEGLVRAYYTTVGWPMMVPTAEQPAFVKKIHSIKEAQLTKLLAKDGMPLRPDVKQVIADAVADGVAVSLLAGTQCTAPEELAASCLRLLGPELAGAVRVFTFALAAPRDEDAGSSGAGAGGGAGEPTLSQMLSAAAGDLKQRAAMQLVASMQSISKEREKSGASALVGVSIDPSLLAAGGDQQRLSSGYISALVATTGAPAGSTIAVGATNTMLQGSFPTARAKFDGFGPGLATWPRMRSLLLNGNGRIGK
ncbi:hypothetical protein GPECTOR_41g706 [Gonium pectorale]|uniref:Uncharacterized protein n=1 Tax=Gonium pectorale TaxID=33097 RepID=A0A150GA71_GONPE|nr:hypothetical protein GPECTOR_41g706 [Gonium pectorale]|eukprot:KXZ46741.1 hypothetical protein GPECTOR_41g706 [Gonium pectorale]